MSTRDRLNAWVDLNTRGTVHRQLERISPYVTCHVIYHQLRDQAPHSGTDKNVKLFIGLTECTTKTIDVSNPLPYVTILLILVN